MNPVIDMLMQEHRLIERALAALERCGRTLVAGGAVDRSVVRDFGDFFANFADKCHHAKEEDRLFATMVDAGFPRDAGPIGVMLHEHGEGRTHVGALRRIGDGSGPLSADERREVAEHAAAYVPLLRQHILKEDRILYPMAERALPPDAFERMYVDFECFETEVTGTGEHQRFHALAEALAAAFPG